MRKKEKSVEIMKEQLSKINFGESVYTQSLSNK